MKPINLLDAAKSETEEPVVQRYTGQIKYEKKLSAMAKTILNSFQKKYIYYAIDDILDLLQSNPREQKNLLAILYSPVISLQNNFSINFFDIWIDAIYLEETFQTNRLIPKDCPISKPTTYITLKLIYKTSRPKKKVESVW